MSKIKLSILFAFYLLIIFGCNNPKDSVKIDETIKIEKIRSPWDIEAIFDNDRFYLLKDLKSLIHVYEKDSLIDNIQNTKTSINGNSLMVTGAMTKRMIDHGSEILIFQSYPNQIKIYNKSDLHLNPDLIKLRIKNTINIIDGFYLGKNNIGLSTYNPDQNEYLLNLTTYNKSNQKITTIYEEVLNHPAKHSLVRNINDVLYILNPYDKKLIELDKKYKVKEAINLELFKEFNLSYSAPPQYNSPNEYFMMSVEEQLASFNDEVYDFYVDNNFLYLLLRKRLINSNQKIQSYSELMKFDLARKTVEKVKAKNILINFDQKGHILQYRQISDQHHLDVFPTENLFNE
ncbi:hypothetical protein ACFSKL_00305 [Belliella marina]|uniref:DUF4221 domain-containing protein n=1 Tax=Belliella marina TaxID=1644146 RepID=A0ABW4VHM8_9BACT